MKINRRNLRKLANHLLNLPENYKHFDMGTFLSVIHGNPENVIEFLPKCGTVACALGHAPSIPGLGAKPRENWRRYAERVLGVDVLASDGTYDWCFCSSWDRVDNTPQGAALRIFYLLDYGLPEFMRPRHIFYASLDMVPTYTNAYDVVLV